MEKRAITIDNGGSELRYISNSEGREIHTMDKKISIIEKDTFRVKDNVDETDIIEITKSPRSEYLNLYAMGRGYYMYSGIDIGMESSNKKSESVSWYQQVLLAIAKDAITACRKINTVSIVYVPSDTDDDAPVDIVSAPVDSLVIDITDKSFDYLVTTLLPVQEHSGAIDYASKLKSKLQGSYEVYFPVITSGVNRVKFTIKPDCISILPEGAVVIASLRNEIKDNEITLVVDMGDLSTDYALFKGFNLIGSSVVSSQFAGGTLLNLISGVIRSHGCVSTDDTAIDALKSNVFYVGKKKMDIKKELDNVKDMFVSNYIKPDLLSQIEVSGYSPQSIQNVIPLGAPLGIKNPEDGSYDILNRIIKECNLINSDIKTFDTDLRYVNIMAAADFCDAIYRKMV